MDINLLIGIVGLVLSIGSFVYAVYVQRKSNLEKKLTYEVIPPVPVAEVIKGSGNYSLRVVYERPNGKPLYIENAYIQLLRFANFGRIPVTKGDLAQTDKFRIEIQEGTVLDITLASVTRSACQIRLGKLTKIDGRTVAEIDFEFLDFLDGGLIQILSDSKALKTSLQGTIVGMSQGIQETSVSTEAIEVPHWGCAVGLLFEIVALASVPFVYRYITGSLNNMWVLALPLLALVIPIVLFYLVMTIYSLRDKSKFPKQLIPPRWYRLGSGWYYPPYKERIRRENERLMTEVDKLKMQIRNMENK